MKEMKTTDMVFRELTADEIRTGKPFSHFSWEGVSAFAFYRMSDAYWEAAKVLLDKMKSNSCYIAITDGLIYPLFFNYRHSIETYLKALFFEHGTQSEKARKKYIKKGHGLENLWMTLRPYLNKSVKHVGSSISLDAVEHYIKEIHRFDPDSTVMRYPITNELGPHPEREKEISLDFMHFADCMDALCDALRQLNQDICCQVEKAATSEEVDGFLGVYKRYKNEIDEFLLSLQNDIECVPIGKRDIGSLVRCLGDPLPEDNQSEPSYKKSLRDYEPDMLILLEALYYVGRSINNVEGRLAVSSKKQRLREFVQLCKDRMEADGLSLGNPIGMRYLSMQDYTPSAIVAALSTSISILKL